MPLPSSTAYPQFPNTCVGLLHFRSHLRHNRCIPNNSSKLCFLLVFFCFFFAASKYKVHLDNIVQNTYKRILKQNPDLANTHEIRHTMNIIVPLAVIKHAFVDEPAVHISQRFRQSIKYSARQPRQYNIYMSQISHSIRCGHYRRRRTF